MQEIRLKPGRSKTFKLSELELQRSKPLSDRLLKDLAFVASLLPECDDWLVVKKQLLQELPVDQRQLFSSRDQRTKLHHPFSNFENRVRDEWKKLTGLVLHMPEMKRMAGVDPELYL